MNMRDFYVYAALNGTSYGSPMIYVRQQRKENKITLRQISINLECAGNGIGYNEI